MTFDAITTTTSQSNFNHTVAAHSNRILWFGATIGASQTISAAKYNGVSATMADSITSGVYTSYLFYLVAPATGTNAVSWTTSGAGFFQGWVSSYYTAKQTGVPDAHTTQSINSNISHVSINSVANNCWTISHAFEDTFGGGVIVADTGSNTSLRIANDFTACFDSNGPKTPAGLINSNLKTSNGLTPSHFVQVVATFAPVPDSTISASIASISLTRQSN